ncbi:MAG: DJ-1/PfpI family protein [Opitutae bacterium]|nr:DJ-1/PfpI family protein [Opitutae bacterium]
MKRTLALLLFDEVEVLDFAGPFEVFAVTDELSGHRLFRVVTVAQEKRAIRARNGLSVNPDHAFADCPRPDILIVPGGFGTRALLKSQPVLDWVKSVNATAGIVASVCTGSLVLAAAGLLNNLRATTHCENFAELAALAPNTEVDQTCRFTDNGRVLTSAGISAGIDMSLHIVARLHGAASADKTARYMEYHWRNDGGATR